MTEPFADPAGSTSGAPGPAATADAGPLGPALRESLRACAALAQDPRYPFPTTIQAAVDRINALPRPVSVACFVASLPRPISVVATASVTSAQPADTRKSPRVFIMGEQLILSIVPDGEGRRLLELGELREDNRSLKAEVEFPVEGTLSDEDPYTQVIFSEGITSCGLCHRDERPHPTIAGAYTSLAFRPRPETEVPLWELRMASEACDAIYEPERCELFEALLTPGKVEQGAFAPDVPLFF